MGIIKDTNGMNLTEAKEIKKRWQEYIEEEEEEKKKIGNHDGVISQLEPEILESDVRWALRSITTNKS